MNNLVQVPPGFRFHPTDEELVDYYLRRKVTSRRIDLDVIKDIDLYRIEPWDLQELCRIGREEQNEWYFFSHKDKKYPTGTRTNRATAAGFWKATGRDKAIYSKKTELIGMRKTLVFYKGRAPNGLKSDWIMHEYRLETDENGTSQEEGWVVCRAFKKRIATTTPKLNDYDDSPVWYDDQLPLMDKYSCKNEMDNLHYNGILLDHHFLQLPNLESPKMITSSSYSNNPLPSQQHMPHQPRDQAHVTDWRVLDKFVASQLSHDDNDDQAASVMNISKENEEFKDLISTKEKLATEINGSTSFSSCHIDLWE